MSGVVSSLGHNMSSQFGLLSTPFFSCMLPPVASCYVCGLSFLVNRVFDIAMLSISLLSCNSAVKISVPQAWEPIVVLVLLEHCSVMLVIIF